VDHLSIDNPSAAAESAPNGLPARTAAGRLRRVVVPALIIAAIIAVIWWIERGGGDVSPSGEKYGPAPLPASLVRPGLDVSAAEGSLAPDFLLEQLDGPDLRLSDYRGQPIVLNFWATWCAPCRKEIPELVQAYDRYSPDDLVVIGLNLQEGKSIVRPYAGDFGMDFPIAIDRDGEVGDEYRVIGLPTTFFIDRAGVVRSVFIGPLQAESDGIDVQGAIARTELDQRIAQILSPEAGD